MLTEFAILACVYVLLSPMVAMPLYERLLFFPITGEYDKALVSQFEKVLADRGITKVDATFPGPQGKQLRGWFFKQPHPGKVMLVSHGNGGNISHRFVLAQILLRCGTSVFLYDYEGYGESEGSPSVPGICADGLAAFDYLVRAEKIPPGDIIAYGESLGTGVSCYLSTQRQVGGLILQSPFPSLLYAAHDRLWFTWLYPSNWFPDLNNLAVLKAAHPPVLIIHGGNDPILPQRYSQVLFDQATAPKQLCLIPDMGHCLDTTDEPEFFPAVRTFLSNLK